MSDKLTTCTTRVRMIIEINGSGPYGLDWKLSDLIKQSRDETINGMRERLRNIGIKIIGEPEVIATVWEETR